MRKCNMKRMRTLMTIRIIRYMHTDFFFISLIYIHINHDIYLSEKDKTLGRELPNRHFITSFSPLPFPFPSPSLVVRQS